MRLPSGYDRRPARKWLDTRQQSPVFCNRIIGLRYRIGGEDHSWLQTTLPRQQRGHAQIDMPIVDLPLGEVLVDVAAVNDRGGIEARPQRFVLQVDDAEIPTRPGLSLRASTQLAFAGLKILAQSTVI